MNMKNTDKITLTIGQLKKLVTESQSFIKEAYNRETRCIERKYEMAAMEATRKHLMLARSRAAN